MVEALGAGLVADVAVGVTVEQIVGIEKVGVAEVVVEKGWVAGVLLGIAVIAMTVLEGVG